MEELKSAERGAPSSGKKKKNFGTTKRGDLNEEFQKGELKRFEQRKSNKTGTRQVKRFKRYFRMQNGACIRRFLEEAMSYKDRGDTKIWVQEGSQSDTLQKTQQFAGGGTNIHPRQLGEKGGNHGVHGEKTRFSNKESY